MLHHSPLRLAPVLRVCGLILSSSLVPAAIVGCNGGDVTPPAKDPPHAEHAHPEKGPHGGALIELGDETYHVEFVHDEEQGKVTFYILDSAAKQAVEIDAAEVVVNLKHEGKGEQYKVAAVRAPGAGFGKSSQFSSSDPTLASRLDAEGAEPQLVVTISGKQYRGTIAHEHHDE